MGSTDSYILALTALSLNMWFILFWIGLLLVLYIQWKSYMDEFKKWSHLKEIKPHWFWGNRYFFSRSVWDDYVDHYFALEGQKYGLFWFGNEAAIFLRDLDLIKRFKLQILNTFMTLDLLEKLMTFLEDL